MFLVFWNLFFFFQRAQFGETREGLPGSKLHRLCGPATLHTRGAAHRVPLCVPQQPTLHATLVVVPKTPWDAWPMLLCTCSQDTAVPAGTVLSAVPFLPQVGPPSRLSRAPRGASGLPASPPRRGPPSRPTGAARLCVLVSPTLLRAAGPLFPPFSLLGANLRSPGAQQLLTLWGPPGPSLLARLRGSCRDQCDFLRVGGEFVCSGGRIGESSITDPRCRLLLGSQGLAEAPALPRGPPPPSRGWLPGPQPLLRSTWMCPDAQAPGGSRPSRRCPVLAPRASTGGSAAGRSSAFTPHRGLC